MSMFRDWQQQWLHLRRGASVATIATALLSSFGVAASSAYAGTTISGAVQSTAGNYLTIQRSGAASGVLAKVIGAANKINAEDYPYVWGGGHGRAGVATTGDGSRTKGFDCSGAVAAVLVAARLWPIGYSVPGDANVIAVLRAYGLIAPGAGSGPNEVTIYDHPGVHIFMNIDGRFWGTSDGGSGADSNGGAGWLHDGAIDVAKSSFRRWHVVASALRVSNTAGLAATFTALKTPGLVTNLLSGDNVTVAYSNLKTGQMVPKSVVLLGQSSVSGTVTAVGPFGTNFTLTTASGSTMLFTNNTGTSLAQAAMLADDLVTVMYTTKTVGGLPTYQARALTITGEATTSTTATTTSTTTSTDPTSTSTTTSTDPTTSTTTSTDPTTPPTGTMPTTTPTTPSAGRYP